MERKKYLYIGALMLLLSGQVFATDNYNKYIYNKDNTVEYTKFTHLFLDSKKSTENTVNLDFQNFNITQPQECNSKTTICEESTDITITTKKTWKIIKLNDITDVNLDSQKFAQYFPSIKETNKVDDSASLQDRLIAQKILYDRGLLPVAPTGKIGWLTELATMKFQFLKGIKEYDTKKGVVYIGSKTIKELNNLKEKMKDAEYLKKNPLPNVSIDSYNDEFKKRTSEIKSLIEKFSPDQNNLYNEMAQKNYGGVGPTKPGYIKIEGSAQILKTGGE